MSEMLLEHFASALIDGRPPSRIAERGDSGSLNRAGSGDWLRKLLAEHCHLFGVCVDGFTDAIGNLVTRRAKRNDAGQVG